MSDLAKRLRHKADMIMMGEKISWQSDTDLMLKSADYIEKLECELEKWQPLHPNPADARYWEGRFRDTDAELVALTELADRLYRVMYASSFDGKNRVAEEYRKARGI